MISLESARITGRGLGPASSVSIPPAMRSVSLAVLTTAVLSAGCSTTSIREMSSSPAPRVHVGTHKRTWEVRSGGEPLGLVVLFEDRARAQDSLYVVRNAWHQDLGLIDGLGRAYRYLPHREEPAWVGSGTIADGAQRILGAASACELFELEEPEGRSLPGTTPAAAHESLEPVPQQPAQPSGDAPSDGGLPQSR